MVIVDSLTDCGMQSGEAADKLSHEDYLNAKVSRLHVHCCKAIPMPCGNCCSPPEELRQRLSLWTLVSQGETVSSTFKTAGTYEYYCEPHQGKTISAMISVRLSFRAITNQVLADIVLTDCGRSDRRCWHGRQGHRAVGTFVPG